ncbi:MAG: D-2-hydroxyacid dehydrogenase [Clostridia bacterium]|nr:D-2-hydroxyacid dehydrogenase [Clostridia bacterium]
MQILVVLPVTELQKKQLENAAPGAAFLYRSPKDATAEEISQSRIIVGNVPADRIRASENLLLMQLNSAGTDAYIRPGVLHPSTKLANATGAYSKAVAEHLFAMGIALQKNLPLYRDMQQQHVWGDAGRVTSMADATVLVVGMGDIGTNFARLCKGVGAKTIGVRRRYADPVEGVDEVHLTEDLDALLPRADVIASFLPGTGATKGIFSRERFALMKPSAIFLNGGRGNAVDQDALADALQNGRLFAAGLDVTDPEPLPADHIFWTLPNLFLTPHISGGFHLPETLDRIVAIAARNIMHVVNGEPIENEVDFETGYRK